MDNKITQRTLVILKPDAMQRNLAGQIIGRIQRIGLKLVDCKIVQADEELAAAHYPVTDEWYEKVGNNSLDDCKKYGFDPKEVLGTDVAKEVGKLIHSNNKKFLMSGPVMPMIFEGAHAIELVRKLVGHTLPVLAAPGTIRGDFSSESAMSANLRNESIPNLVHASSDPEEAAREIELWFPSNS